MSAIPPPATNANVWVLCLRPQELDRNRPTARPAKAKPVQGKIGKSHGRGSPRLCTPLMYDSSGHGSQGAGNVVHSTAVSREMVKAVAAAAQATTGRGRRDFPAANKPEPHLTP